MENGYIKKDYKSIIKFVVNKFDFYRKYMGLKRMDVYIIQKFLGTFFFALGLILLIVVVFDISERIEKFIEYKAPLKEIVFGYYMNFLPYFANVFSPLFTSSLIFSIPMKREMPRRFCVKFGRNWITMIWEEVFTSGLFVFLLCG